MKMRPGTYKWFYELRHNPKAHIGFGDVRLTMGQQDEISNYIAKLEDLLLGVEDFLGGLPSAGAHYWASEIDKVLED